MPDTPTSLPQIVKDARSRGLSATAFLLLVDATNQRLSVWQGDHRLAIYPVSTSRTGLACERDSLATPTGFHEVADRIGDGYPPGQVFVSRKPTNDVLAPTEWASENGEDWILTRILRLRGLESGVNQGDEVDSYDRYIYIHGTNQEHRLGLPASRGCVRMANRDILALFNLLQHHPAWCWIGDRVA
jgi:lipoprotein-anchoring transpeptidase ErfK/SrfK